MDTKRKDLVSKPVGPFDTFSECEQHFADDPSVDDPEALCGWMEAHMEVASEFDPAEDDIEEFLAGLNDPASDTVLTNLKVEYVSGVETPAQDSQWVYAKDVDRGEADWGVEAPILLHEATQTVKMGDSRAPYWDKADDEEDEEQKAWAPVLIPNETDKQGDVIPANEIEQAAHQFLARYRKIDTDHDLMDGKGVPIESWTLKQDQAFTRPDGTESREYPAGTWMLGVQFGDEAWKRVKSGDLTGFSIYGQAEAIDIDVLLGGGDGPTPASAAMADGVVALESSVTALAKAAEESINPLMGDNTDDDGEPSVEDTLASIKETVEQTKDSVESHGETLEKHTERLDGFESRLDDLEADVAEVKEADEGSDDEAGEADASKDEGGDTPEGDEADAGKQEGEDDEDDEDEDDEEEMAQAVAALLDVPVSQVLEAFDSMKESEKGTEGDDGPDVDEVAEKVLKELEDRGTPVRKAGFEPTAKGAGDGPVDLDWSEEDVREAIPE